MENIDHYTVPQASRDRLDTALKYLGRVNQTEDAFGVQRFAEEAVTRDLAGNPYWPRIGKGQMDDEGLPLIEGPSNIERSAGTTQGLSAFQRARSYKSME